MHPGRRKTYGGFAYLSRGVLPGNRAYIERYLTVIRENLILDIGGSEENLTAAQIILIDRIISKLGCVRCIEEHIRENSVMVGKDLAPSLKTSYLAYNNSLRLDLQLIGIDKRSSERILSPLELARELDGEKAGSSEGYRDTS